jgi:peptidoglycan/xylan/chitin deacetylase (PgdA/CDA1 family)
MLVSPPYFARIFYPEAIWRINSTKAGDKKVFLTFDDGPIPEVTEWVLSFLEAEKIRASFFCVGNNVELHPKIFEKVNLAGHVCANHSYNHLSGWSTNNKDYFENIEKCNKFYTNNFFRPPFGKIKLSQYSKLKKKYQLVFWDVVSFDFDANTSPENCVKNVIENTRNGSIIVFHDSKKAEKNMKYALPKVVHFLKQEGYEFAVL